MIYAKFTPNDRKPFDGNDVNYTGGVVVAGSNPAVPTSLQVNKAAAYRG